MPGELTLSLFYDTIRTHTKRHKGMSLVEFSQGSLSMLPMQQKFKRSPSIVSRTIAGETILVPIRKSVGDMESIYNLNETATLVWNLLDGQHTLGEIQSQMVLEFQVEADQAHEDLLELLDELSRFGAIEIV
jgi:hypothetical protein